MLVAKGPAIWSGTGYLEWGIARPLVILATVPAAAYMLSTGLVAAQRRTLGRVLGLLCGLMLFAYGTRLFAASYFLYVCGRWLGRGKVTGSSWLLAFGSVLMFFPAPLAVRGFPAHGLLPYSQGIVESISGGDYFYQIDQSLAANIGFGIPLLCYMAQRQDVTQRDMVISLNPATGDQAGWANIEPLLRVHEFIPFSALGEWASFGLPTLFAAVLIWALVVRWCISTLAVIPGALGFAATLGTCALASYSAVLATQYNTRTVMRILSLVVLAALLTRLGHALLAGFTRHR